MRSLRLGILLWCGTLLSYSAGGMFARIETQAVPIGRALSNLQQRLTQDTNDVKTTYYLGRLYSMAYSTNLTEVQISKKSNFPVFYESYNDSEVPQSVQAFA